MKDAPFCTCAACAGQAPTAPPAPAIPFSCDEALRTLAEITATAPSLEWNLEEKEWWIVAGMAGVSHPTIEGVFFEAAKAYDQSWLPGDPRYPALLAFCRRFDPHYPARHERPKRPFRGVRALGGRWIAGHAAPSALGAAKKKPPAR